MKLEDITPLNEITTLSRVYSHFQDMTRPVAIMSAYRDSYDPRANVQRGKALAADVKNAKFGYVFIDGSYIENQGTPQETKVDEVSILIIGYPNDSGNLKSNLLKQLMGKYEQESVIYRPQNTPEIFLLHNNGTQQALGKFYPNQIGDYMSRLRGRGERAFIIEGAHHGKTWMARLAEYIKTKNK